MGRSLQASIDGVKTAELALKRKGWTHDYLAGGVRCSRQVVGNFLARKPVEKRLFQAICAELKLEWGDIAELEASDGQAPQLSSVDELVQAVRGIIRENVQNRYGTMRVLDMTQPIQLDDIYTDVNILEKVAGRRRVGIDELVETARTADFNRFGLSNVQEKRVAGIDAVEAHQKLIILGRPGAGKSTFLKHLTLQCIAETFQGQRIPVFVTLKDFAEATDQPSLLDYLQQLLSSYGVAHDVKVTTGVLASLLNRNETAVKQLLRQGRLLILLDGLDEVREVDNKRVLKQIQSLADEFDQNQFVITCRIAAKEYTFEQFTEVEIADFTDEQIFNFVDKWFLAKNDLVKAERFVEKLKDNHRIRELATNPLLLTLLCLVFGELGSFPPNRAELYREGLDALLKRWDNSRNIERDEIYRGLALQRKEDLLSQIAWNRFEQGDYFFKQDVATEEITQYIQNLPNAKTDSEDLQIDSKKILESIEAQHGLLVERARGIYSFSHLTFQEYFAARRVKEEGSEAFLQALASHVTETRWREIFLLTVGMLKKADRLLVLMKHQIDGLLANDEQLQQFLCWATRKSRSVTFRCKAAAVRAFYFDLALDLDLDLDLALDLALDRDRDRDRDRNLAPILILDEDPDRDLASDRDRDRDLALALDRDLDLALDLARGDLTLDRDLDRALARACACVQNSDLQNQLEKVRKRLPTNSTSANKENFKLWWQTDGEVWTQQLRTILIQHRDIGHDWLFSEAQKKTLQQYYDANRLLIACLNSDCYVSREVRQEIEETLLLPMEEIPSPFLYLLGMEWIRE